MSWRRAWAITVRQLYNFKHSLDRLSDGIYWPAFDIVLWGLTSRYLQAGNQTPHLVLIILTGLVFWQIIWRSQYDITVSLLEEFWSQNLVNLFASPLLLKEWVLGVFILAFLKIIGTIVFTFGLTWLLYSINITSFGWVLLPFFANLLLIGWWIGLFVSGLIFLYGRQIQALAWVGASLIAPFSAIYYPVSSLPKWAQTIAYALPASYIFEGMREIVANNTFPLNKLLISFGLNLLYFLLAAKFFHFCFKKTKQKGLARLE